MDRRTALLREASEAEALARLVSYQPDKQRFLDRAATLRAEAAALEPDVLRDEQAP